MRKRRVVESRSGELIVLLGELKALHEELLEVIQQKLAAIRRADTDGLNSCLARERFLSDRILQRDGLRQQLVQLIGKALEIDPDRVRHMSLSELAEELSEPVRGQLLGLSADMRQTLLAIDSANKVAALVTDEMLKHFRQVYAVMAQSEESAGTYTARGRRTDDRPVQVFEAVG